VPGGAAHPGEGQLDALAAREARDPRPGEDVERPAEALGLDDDPFAPQRRLPARVGPDRRGLLDAGAPQRRHEIDEIGLGAAFAGRAQEVEDAHPEAKLAVPPGEPKPLEGAGPKPYNPRLAPRRAGAVAG
jgi:hypothetical protein